ncbi:hypothetical protein F5882DRAFT_524103 [Hyaloscypha sp. PMI_1271]|nr:hypothetical protein F5882DRAFT_524103 [Hyaloscypha sp. PMI_1271]
MQISFQIVALALLVSSLALPHTIKERDNGLLIVDRNPDPKKGALLKGALGLIGGLVAGGAAAGAATPAAGAAAPGSSVAASTSPQPSTGARRRHRH